MSESPSGPVPAPASFSGAEGASLLAPWAARDATSRGRRHPEEDRPRYRSEYQRDRDRIVHSSAFRRLEYKTQVFVNHEGDMFRTRLTHSLEVAQIARSAARALGLNEDLTEAICLAHDLGHTPFGHAGQDALDRCMQPWGGFEHNLQSLRVVEELEERYAGFDGLNLTFETREGILKHCRPEHARALGELGRRFLEGGQPTLEAQLANVCDEIAYNNHDVDDGLRAGLLDLDALARIRIFGEPWGLVRERWPELSPKRAVHEVVRRMIDRLVSDLVETTRARIEARGIDSVQAVRAQPEPLVDFSEPTRAAHLELKRFLHRRLYRHYRVLRMARKAGRVVSELFEAFMEEPRLLPPDSARRVEEGERARGEAGRARAIADYVAGMTDRFALAEHERLFSPGALT